MHEAIDDLAADVLVEAEQPRRLADGQGQSRHFHELGSNPIGDGVYVHCCNSFVGISSKSRTSRASGDRAKTACFGEMPRSASYEFVGSTWATT